MKNALIYNDLIHAIEKLYSSVTLRILQKRMKTYHQAPSTDNYTEHALDIKAPLFKYIDDISSNDQKTVTEVQTLDYSFFSQTTHQHTSTHSELTSQRIVIKENNSGLSKHFNTKHNDAEFHPGIDEKLKHSIWEHIHASIRHARLGDARVAKVHADIANSAYKELAHYVSSEAHTEFALEIEDQLDVLLKNK